MEKYNPQEIEKKWQKYWSENPELYAAQEKSEKEKKFILDMFPYPSGDGLHVGHVESYTATDIVSRYLRMNGKNVLHPQGWDAFGLPAENYAIKTKIHPSGTTKKAIETFKGQMNRMGFSYDWSREVNSSDPDYYKWTQWFFLLLYKNNLAYKKKAKVNWCECCQTVLANEQAEGGCCERCKHKVIQKDLEQWFFKITDFVEDKEKTSGLISGLDKVDWPQSTKLLQKNWIGRSEGVQFRMNIAGAQEKLEVYTTRIDTVFGMTYVVIAPEHEIIENLKSKISNINEVEKYIEKAKSKTELERTELQKEKTGVKLEGIEVINPFNNEKLPLFVADYVLGGYGTGAVMAVPAHDERDWEFAKKNSLPIKEVIMPILGEAHENEVVRKTVSPLIKRKSDGRLLFLKMKGAHNGVITTIIGGIEEKESFAKAAERETLEETGYKAKFVKTLGEKLESHFYQSQKKEWRMRIDQPVMLELVDENPVQEVADHEKELQEVIWLTEEEAYKELPYESDIIRLNRFFGKNTAYINDGRVMNSGEYDGLTSREAREKISQWLFEKGIGGKKVNYRLRDWLVSRQRYWGAPIPIIYCEKCGEVPVPEKDLPVELPDDVDFLPTGESPLVKSKKFHRVRCPKCGEEARRESDTMDTFVCSSWYYLRYSDPNNKHEFASKKSVEKWLPVDLYVGGAEHSVLHLLYARFFTKVLHNLGYVGFDEPFLKLRHQGTILAEDGRKMSKSLGNVINPDQVVDEYGADALRMFEMFMGPLEAMKPWNTKGIVGIVRFLEKIWKIQEKVNRGNIIDNKIHSLVHKTIKKVTGDIENFRFNTAISQLMILVNEMEKQEEIKIADYRLLLTMLSPFAPHITEELWWNNLGHKNSIFQEKWPVADEKYLIQEEIEMVVQVNGKLRDRIFVAPDVTEDEAKETALENEKIKTFIEGKEIIKVIFVPGRLINIVIK